METLARSVSYAQNKACWFLVNHPAFHPPNQLFLTFQAQFLFYFHCTVLRILIRNNPNHLWVTLCTPHFGAWPHAYLYYYLTILSENAHCLNQFFSIEDKDTEHSNGVTCSLDPLSRTRCYILHYAHSMCSENIQELGLWTKALSQLSF